VKMAVLITKKKVVLKEYVSKVLRPFFINIRYFIRWIST
jgi:hypothetical protein